MPLIENDLWQDLAYRYKWESVGLLKTVELTIYYANFQIKKTNGFLWAAKTTSLELETFLYKVERSLFSGPSRKLVSENLSKGERESLLNWRKAQLFNPCGDLVFWSQGKGNRFVILDKERRTESWGTNKT